MRTISVPTLVVDTKKSQQNIQKLKLKAEKHKLKFRPHFKTHQHLQVGHLFRQTGVKTITVSSISMAAQFVNDGWDDVLVAFPFNILEMDKLNDLSKKAKMQVLVESIEVIQFLQENLLSSVGVSIKVDSGYGRTGLKDIEQIGKLVEQIERSSKLQFIGFVIHAGHTYKTESIDEILKIHAQTEEKGIQLKNKFPEAIVSIGDTPSCSLADTFKGIDEIRPGNFVYYDMTQYFLGACRIEEIAVSIACPVVAKHPERNELVLYGGGVHLSKEFLMRNNEPYFGAVVEYSDSNSWSSEIPNCHVKSISQEHGIVRVTDELMKKIQIGDLLGVLPVHSCMSANLLLNNTILI